MAIMASLVLSYRTVEMQKQQFLQSACGEEPTVPSTFPLQITSSILVLTALLYFYRLSGKKISQSTGEPQKEDCLNHFANTLVILAALIRFGLLTKGDTHLDD